MKFEFDKKPCQSIIRVKKLKRGNLTYEDVMAYDYSNYYIYKGSASQREVTYEEFFKFEYSSYVFFQKDVYDKNHIEMWLKYLKENKLHLLFLDNYFPPFDPNEKIIIKNEIQYKKPKM